MSQPNKGKANAKTPGKGSSSNGSNGTKITAGSSLQQQQVKTATLEVVPLKRALKVQVFWDQLPQELHTQLLRLSLTCLRQHAAKISPLPGQPEMTGSLELGLSRLAQAPTWERWQWGTQGQKFTSAAAFRSYVRRQQVPAHLRHLVCQDRKSEATKSAKQSLQKRMLELQKEIAAFRTRQEEEEVRQSWKVAWKSALICVIFEKLQTEHPFVYDAMVAPIIHAVQTLLPKNVCHICKPGTEDDYVLSFTDVDQLDTAAIRSVTTWLEQQICSMIMLAAPETDHENMESAKPFEVADHGSKLAVTSGWLSFLKSPAMMQCTGSSVSMETTTGATPGSAGPALDWLYSTHAAALPKQTLPGQKMSAAFELLTRTLQDMVHTEGKLEQVEGLLNSMRIHRRLIFPVAASSGIRVGPRKQSQGDVDIPPNTVGLMLQREAEIAKAKCCNTAYLLQQAQRRMFALNKHICQASAEHEYLETLQLSLTEHMEDLNRQQRGAMPKQWERTGVSLQLMQEGLGLEGAMQALEDQMRDIDKKQDAALKDISRHSKSVKQLRAWGEDVITLHMSHRVAVQRVRTLEADLAEPNHTRGSMRKLLVEAEQEVNNLKKTFQKEVWPKLSTPDEDKAWYRALQLQKEQLTKHYEEGCAVLPWLEGQMVDAACSDPGALLLPHLILPLLQQQVESKAVAAAKESHSGASTSTSRNTTATPTIEQLQGHYSGLLEKTDATEPVSDTSSRWTQALKDIVTQQELQQMDKMVIVRNIPLYAAYLDDLMLREVPGYPDTELMVNIVANEVVGSAGSDATWLTLLLCSHG